ncbi:hypothetical protein [Mycolicibacterium psychrotolerans]|uniref:hypothetical protein n=1 Tax=Mycolicibacterium psychrotolerans TaxID=216929 RepID=UPI0013D17FBC|nr:hypothetical protein [Mycolicibacterium psychrotolerans]
MCFVECDVGHQPGRAEGADADHHHHRLVSEEAGSDAGPSAVGVAPMKGSLQEPADAGGTGVMAIE